MVCPFVVSSQILFAVSIKMTTNLLPLPDHLCEKVYLYDHTYRVIFDVCLTQMMFEFAQREELNDLLIDQELDRKIFTFNANIYIQDQLHGTGTVHMEW